MNEIVCEANQVKTSINADRPEKFRSRKRKRNRTLKKYPTEDVHSDQQSGMKEINLAKMQSKQKEDKGVFKTFLANTNKTRLENLRGKFKEVTL